MPIISAFWVEQEISGHLGQCPEQLGNLGAHIVPLTFSPWKKLQTEGVSLGTDLSCLGGEVIG